MSDSFNYGDKPTFTATAKANGVAADAAKIKFYERKPDGTSANGEYPLAGTITVTKTGTGTYAVTRSMNLSGIWNRRWEVYDAGGNLIATTEDIEFYVAPSLFH